MFSRKLIWKTFFFIVTPTLALAIVIERQNVKNLFYSPVAQIVVDGIDLRQNFETMTKTYKGRLTKCEDIQYVHSVSAKMDTTLGVLSKACRFKSQSDQNGANQDAIGSTSTTVAPSSQASPESNTVPDDYLFVVQFNSNGEVLSALHMYGNSNWPTSRRGKGPIFSVALKTYENRFGLSPKIDKQQIRVNDSFALTQGNFLKYITQNVYIGKFELGSDEHLLVRSAGTGDTQSLDEIKLFDLLYLNQERLRKMDRKWDEAMEQKRETGNSSGL